MKRKREDDECDSAAAEPLAHATLDILAPFLQHVQELSKLVLEFLLGSTDWVNFLLPLVLPTDLREGLDWHELVEWREYQHLIPVLHRTMLFPRLDARGTANLIPTSVLVPSGRDLAWKNVDGFGQSRRLDRLPLMVQQTMNATLGNRRLDWQLHAGRALVQVRFRPGCVRDVSVSTLQMLLLMMLGEQSMLEPYRFFLLLQFDLQMNIPGLQSYVQPLLEPPNPLVAVTEDGRWALCSTYDGIHHALDHVRTVPPRMFTRSTAAEQDEHIEKKTKLEHLPGS
jgi:hypothetical protein